MSKVLSVLCELRGMTKNGCLLKSTDYGRPMKPFFIKILNFWAWADKILHDAILGNWGIFDQLLSTHYSTMYESFVHVFH